MTSLRKTWDIREFGKVNLPEIIGQVSPKFSAFRENNRIRVLDMPIYMPGQGWKIPSEIADQFGELISLVEKSENRFEGGLQEHYVYITIDQKIVQKGSTGRRAGAHSDAYVESKGAQIDITPENIETLSNQPSETVGHTYVISDVLPTEFFSVPFPLTKGSCGEALRTFEEIAASAVPVTYPTNTLLRMDPFVVHRCAISPITTPRTFVKISVSKKRYARIGNTINPSFQYDWEMTARSPHTRNHPWA